MEVSYKFKNINVNMEKIFMAICENKNIAKYVYYLDHRPLSKPDVNVNLKKEGHYIINYYDGVIPSQDKIRLFFNFLDADFTRPPLGSITFLVEIVIPQQYWILEGSGELRGVNILDEIAQMIDQQLGYGIGEAIISKGVGKYVPNSNYNVMSAIIKINSSAIKGSR